MAFTANSIAGPGFIGNKSWTLINFIAVEDKSPVDLLAVIFSAFFKLRRVSP
jgi:hypothetical protein